MCGCAQNSYLANSFPAKSNAKTTKTNEHISILSEYYSQIEEIKPNGNETATGCAKETQKVKSLDEPWCGRAPRLCPTVPSADALRAQWKL